MDWQYTVLVLVVGFCAVTLFDTTTSTQVASAQYIATTSVSLTVCGDAIIDPATEFCDDGTNTGAYGNSILGRNCDPLCAAWGPFCGDGVIQTFYGE